MLYFLDWIKIAMNKYRWVYKRTKENLSSILTLILLYRYNILTPNTNTADIAVS